MNGVYSLAKQAIFVGMKLPPLQNKTSANIKSQSLVVSRPLSTIPLGVTFAKYGKASTPALTARRSQRPYSGSISSAGRK
jgi:hypothetical protein